MKQTNKETKPQKPVIDRERFLSNLHMQYALLASFFETSEIMTWRTDFMCNLLQSFATSEHFNALPNDKKSSLMLAYSHILWVLEQLDEMFDDTVIDNASLCTDFLEDMLFTGKSNRI